jgi:hypothetical protein
LEPSLPTKYHWIFRAYYWLTERLYNELACLYDAASWLVSLGQWGAWRKCALDFLIGSEMLEIGFGTSELLLEMAHRNIRVVGLDSSPAMQRIARNKLHRHGFHVPRVQGIAQQTPFADNSFDSIISTFPAGYIFNLDTWREVARLLRKKGSTAQPLYGRFIVVGLFVIITGRLRFPGLAFLLNQSQDDVFIRVHQLAESAGLDVRIEIRSFPGHDLPIIVAEKSK